VETYRRTLHWLRDEWTALRLASPAEPFPVYVFELTETSNGLPHIFWDGKRLTWACALPSRTAKTTKSEELRYFRGVAVHEGTHCYCIQQSGFFRGQTYLPEPWHWISEGTAVWMELRLLDQSRGLRSHEALSLCRDWCDYPEHPILTLGQYQCGMLVRYLAKQWGPALIGQLWTKGTWRDDPWDLIRRLIGKEHILPEYAVEAYFFGDPASACYSPEIAKRFLSRGLTESVVLETDSREITIPGMLQDTGVRYYAIRAGGRNQINMAFRCGSGNCVAAVSASDTSLRRIGSATPLGSVSQQVSLPGGAEHLVVAVTAEPRGWIRPCKREYELLLN